MPIYPYKCTGCGKEWVIMKGMNQSGRIERCIRCERVMEREWTEEEVAKLPTEFRGCWWDDGWNFDGPGVVYYPRNLMRFGDGGNYGCVEGMIEDITNDLIDRREFDDCGLRRECKWRGWSLRGFAKRKQATHVVVRITWHLVKGEPEPLTWEVSKTQGPPEEQGQKDCS